MGLRYQNFWHCQPLSGLTESERFELFDTTGLETATESPAQSYLVRIGG